MVAIIIFRGIEIPDRIFGEPANQNSVRYNLGDRGTVSSHAWILLDTLGIVLWTSCHKLALLGRDKHSLVTKM